MITHHGARTVRTLALLVAGAAVAGAATFNYSVSCAQVTIGPSTIQPFNGSPGSVVLSPNVSLVTTLLPINASTHTDNPLAPPGTFVGTLSCSLTLGGVVTPYTRSLSLVVVTGQLTIGAASFTVDLGPQGKVDVSVPVDTTIGYDSSQSTYGQPLIADTTLLLHDVPGGGSPPAATGVPMSPWSLAAAGLGLLAMGWYATKRGLVRL